MRYRTQVAATIVEPVTIEMIDLRDSCHQDSVHIDAVATNHRFGVPTTMDSHCAPLESSDQGKVSFINNRLFPLGKLDENHS